MSTPPVPWPKRVRRMLRARLILGVLFLLSLLPLGVSRGFARLLGGLAFVLSGRDRRRALSNLRRAFPEKSEAERRRIARDSFRHLGECLMEVVRERAIDRRIDELVEIPNAGLATLRAALDEGRGAVVVTGHVGNWELLARRIAREGIPVSVVARELNAPLLTDAMDGYRRRGGVTTLWRGRPNTTKAMLRVFRENGLLGLLIDQDTRVQNVFVPFFGRMAATPRAAGDLCVRTGAPLLAAFIHREGGKHRISLHRVEVPRTGDRDTDSLALTRAATLAIEQAVRAHPEQWVWMHERWKTRPEADEVRGALQSAPG